MGKLQRCSIPGCNRMPDAHVRGLNIYLCPKHEIDMNNILRKMGKPALREAD